MQATIEAGAWDYPTPLERDQSEMGETVPTYRTSVPF